MFKKLTTLAVAAVAGIMLLAGCAPKESPTEVVQKANFYQNHKNFESVKHYYTADFVGKETDEGKTIEYNFDELKSLCEIVTCMTSPDFSLEKFFALIKDNKKIVAKMESSTEEIDQMSQLLSMMSAEKKQQLNAEFQQEFIKPTQEAIQKTAASFKVIEEKVDGDTATVTAEADSYDVNDEGKVFKDGKIKIVYTLKKIDNEWKITKTVETEK